MCLAQGPQRSESGEARTRNLSVSSQALYHWATALPVEFTLVKVYNRVYVQIMKSVQNCTDFIFWIFHACVTAN